MRDPTTKTGACQLKQPVALEVTRVTQSATQLHEARSKKHFVRYARISPLGRAALARLLDPTYVRAARESRIFMVWGQPDDEGYFHHKLRSQEP